MYAVGMRYPCRFTINLTDETLSALHALAESSGIPAGVLARQAIHRFLREPAIALPQMHADGEHIESSERTPTPA